MTQRKIIHAILTVAALLTPVLQTVQDTPPNVPIGAVWMSALVGLLAQLPALLPKYFKPEPPPAPPPDQRR